MYQLNQPGAEVVAFQDMVSTNHNFPDADAQTLRWYAIHTRARHEKRVRQQLEGKSLEVFLPIYESVHRWNDRRAVVGLPLFPGYVFVRTRLADRMQVVTVPGVVRLVGSLGRPTPIPDGELAAVRDCCTRQMRMEPHPYLAVGKQVRIKHGPLEGMTGILVRRKGRFRLVLSINSITRSLAVEVDAGDVVPVNSYAPKLIA
jgi:transcription antitermination factor NusG